MTCRNLLFSLLLIAGVDVPAQTVQRLDASVRAGAAAVVPGQHDSVVTKIVSGDGWETDIVLLNMGTAPLAFRQFFMDADGKSTAVTFRADGDAQAMTAASAGAILNPGASLKLTVSGSEQPYQESWSVISDDGAQNSLSGYAVIRRRTTPGNFQFEAATPLSTMQDFSVYMPFDNTQGFRTQLTLVNPASNLPGQVRLTYRSLTGETLLIDSIVMKPGQQTSIVIPDAYPDLANKAGNVFVEANINRFSAVGIRYNERSGAIAPVPRLAFMAE